MKRPAGTVLSHGRPWGRAALWLAFLGPFFFATYGLATWVTARRPEVGSIVFGWEHAIPFVAWTIVPYWSIDLLYGLSLFVCADRRELDTHAKRMLTAQIVAIASFLLFPLRFTFQRPETGGVFGDLFRLLTAFDQPFNQAPSLHVALLVILWALFARRLHGVARIALHAWLALIGVSVLTTWQHHFVDLPTGALLGFLCLWLWPQEQPAPFVTARWTRDPRRSALALRYAIGALAAAALAIVNGGAALWALWVTAALGLVALNYAWLGAAGFEKRDGRLSPAALALLAPYLAGALVNAWAWTRSRSPFDPVADDVWLGRMPSPAELERGGFEGVVDLTCEMAIDPGRRAYANIPVLDLTLPDRAALGAAVEAIERLRPRGRVLVCCALGVSRSAVAVAAWLVATGRAPDAEAALGRVRAARPQIVLGDAHRVSVAAMAPRPAVA
jgi:protein-tyrosine phosphatase/membrane-associated phospholipid phosphatase